MGELGVKNFSVGICDGARSTAHSSYVFIDDSDTSLLLFLKGHFDKPVNSDGMLLHFGNDPGRNDSESRQTLSLALLILNIMPVSNKF